MVLILLSILLPKAHAQMNISDCSNGICYGNEWINHDQSYFKIKVSTDGVYRVDYAELTTADPDLVNNLPQITDFQLFYRGQQVPIYVSGTGSFSTEEYIEFYGKKNDGWLDQFLYVEEEMQANPDHSMFTDESVYFLTWETASPDGYERYNDYTSSSTLTKENYCWSTVKAVYSTRYNRGETFTSSTDFATQRDGISPRYYTGEGFVNNVFDPSGVFTLSTPNPYVTGQNSTITSQYTTERGNHSMSYTIGTANYTSPSFSGWVAQGDTFAITSSILTATTDITVSNPDSFRMASISIEYPRTFDLDNADYFEFSLDNNGQEQYVEFTNFSAGANPPVLYDLTYSARIVTTNDAGVIKAVLPASAPSGKRQCVLVSTNDISAADNVEKRAFVEFDFFLVEHDYIILSGPELFDDGNGVNYVQNYADYRASAAGGFYNPIVVDVTQIYDQFGYGVDRHEQSIRNFLKRAEIPWGASYLFIIGKGWDKINMRNTGYSEYDIVPTFGYPHADYGFVLANDSNIPSLAVGRLSAYTPEQVRIYLDKIQEYETVLDATPQNIDDKSWAKNVLHFGGGDVLIQETIKRELRDLGDNLETSTFGANVTNFFAQQDSTSVDADLAIDFIQEGASMLTFFGHSAANTIDFDIGSPEDYSNLPNYPLFYAIGCNTNTVFTNRSTLSEDYVLIEDKGAIAWYGNTWVTTLGGLIPVAENFYTNLGTNMYGGTFGSVFRQALIDFSPSVGQNTTNEMVLMSSMLHGDPAIRLHPHDFPDYIVDEAQTDLSVKLVTLQDDSIAINLQVANLGLNLDTPLSIDITHLAPGNNNIFSGQYSIDAPAYSENYLIKIPFAGEPSSLGMNQLQFTIDSPNAIAEVLNGGEANNLSTLTFYVVETEVKPSYPVEFSIHSKAAVKLKASTFNAPTATANYHFQIALDGSFATPLASTTINSTAGVIEWEPGITLQEDSVYYWRVSAGDLSSASTLNWKVSSFTQMSSATSEGWNQQDFFQYERNVFDRMIQNSVTEVLEFEARKKNIKTVNSTNTSLNFGEMTVFEDGFRTTKSNFPCDNSYIASFERINMLVYDKFTVNNDVVSPAPNCFNWEIDFRMYDPSLQADRNTWMNDIDNIDDGDYVIIFSRQRGDDGYSVQDWAADSVALGRNIFQVLEQQGITLAREIQTKENPFIFIFQKGNPEFFEVQIIAENRFEIIEGRTNFTGRRGNGNLTSAEIGPASSWASVEWSVSDTTASDEVELDVIGIDANGQETTLFAQQTANSIDISSIDASQYPKLKLNYFARDPANRTPGQLDYWRVFYTPAVDLAVAPNMNYRFEGEELSLGDQLELDVAIANLSDVAITNPIDVEVTISDTTGVVVATMSESIATLAAGDTTTLALSYDTELDLNLSEDQYELRLEVNPMRSPAEFCYDNNDLGPILFDIIACLQNETLVDPFTTTRTIKVSNTITASNVIESGADVIYSAGTLITLQVGFHAQAGSDFHAFLGGCSLTPPSAMRNDAASDETYESFVEVRNEAIAAPEVQPIQIRVVPNPVLDYATVEFFMPTAERVNIYVSDLNGRVVTQLEAMDVQAGWNTSRFYPADLTSGIYLVMIQGKNGIKVERFTISK
ncbi:MAG: C25 family cysteine peptidase [Bacteroidota bacterium]